MNVCCCEQVAALVAQVLLQRVDKCTCVGVERKIKCSGHDRKMLQCSAHIDKMFGKQGWYSAREQPCINRSSNCRIKRNLGKHRCTDNRFDIVHT